MHARQVLKRLSTARTALVLTGIGLTGCSPGTFFNTPAPPVTTPPVTPPPAVPPPVVPPPVVPPPVVPPPVVPPPVVPPPVVPPPVTPPPTPEPYSGPTFTVKAMAGGAPLVGATINFYSAGSTGLGSAATTLATSVTDATGTASVPANYTCSAGTALTYLVATGGTVGASATSNGSIALLAAVGPCGGVASGSSYVVNEITSVAAIYALSPFYAGGSIGASATNLSGLTNAFATAATLANVSTGQSTGTTLPANGALPNARINSIANALNACIVKASACSALYAQSPGGTPSNTLEALYNLAAYPGKQPAAVYAESLLSSAYAPVLAGAPLDWTVFVQYKGGGLNNPTALGVDSTGSVWVANYFYTASKFSPIGTPVFASGITGSGLYNSFGLAIDGSDNVYITNEQPYHNSTTTGSVTELSSAGVSLAGTAGFIAGGLNYPTSVALDPNGTTWVVDFGNSHVTLLSKNGSAISGPVGYTTPLFGFPVVVAVDGNHFGWIGNQSDRTVTRVAPDGTGFTNYQCCDSASAIAIDAGNNVWVANFYGNSISLISNTGVVLSNGTFTGAGSVNHPQGIVLDGKGNVFVSNYRAGYVTELAGATAAIPGASLSPATGLGGDANLVEAFGIAVDASGNVWVASQGNDTVTKFIGLASPVKTPAFGLPTAP